MPEGIGYGNIDTDFLPQKQTSHLSPETIAKSVFQKITDDAQAQMESRALALDRENERFREQAKLRAQERNKAIEAGLEGDMIGSAALFSTEEILRIKKETPLFFEAFSSSENFARYTVQDVDKAGFLERQVDYATDLFKSAGVGLTHIGVAALRGKEMSGGELSDAEERALEWLHNTGIELNEDARQTVDGIARKYTSLADWPIFAAQQIPNMAAAIASAGAGFAVGGPAGAAGGAWGFTTFLESGLIYDELVRGRESRGEEIDVDELRNISIAFGSFNGVFEVLGMKYVGKLLPTAIKRKIGLIDAKSAARALAGQDSVQAIIGNLLVRLGKGGFVEAGTEGVQEASNEIAAVYDAGGFENEGDVWRFIGSDELWSRVGHAAIEGAISAITLGGASGVGGAVHDYRRSEIGKARQVGIAKSTHNEVKSMRSLGMIAALDKYAADFKDTGFPPEMHEYIDKVMQNAESNEVHIDADELLDLIFDLKDALNKQSDTDTDSRGVVETNEDGETVITPGASISPILADIEDALGDITIEQLEELAKTGQNVVVSAGMYVTRIAPHSEILKRLHRKVKMKSDELNWEELEGARETRSKEQADLEEKINDEFRLEEEAEKVWADTIAPKIAEQVEKAGAKDFDAEKIEGAAQLVHAYRKARASAEGISIEEAYEKYGYNLTASERERDDQGNPIPIQHSSRVDEINRQKEAALENTLEANTPKGVPYSEQQGAPELGELDDDTKVEYYNDSIKEWDDEIQKHNDDLAFFRDKNKEGEITDEVLNERIETLEARIKSAEKKRDVFYNSRTGVRAREIIEHKGNLVQSLSMRAEILKIAKAGNDPDIIAKAQKDFDKADRDSRIEQQGQPQQDEEPLFQTQWENLSEEERVSKIEKDYDTLIALEKSPPSPEIMFDLESTVSTVAQGAGITRAEMVSIVRAVELERDATGAILAPNGEVSNLPQWQAKLTRTDEFKAWFGGSKVVDENGEPRLVYHATDSNTTFSEFNTEGEMGAHFGTQTQARQRAYDKNQSDVIPEGSRFKAPGKRGLRTIPVFIRLENPALVTDVRNFSDGESLRSLIPYLGEDSGFNENITQGDIDEVLDGIEDEDLYYDNAGEIVQRRLKEKGYDGIVYVNMGEADTGVDGANVIPKESYAVFDGSQVAPAFALPRTEGIMFETEEDRDHLIKGADGESFPGKDKIGWMPEIQKTGNITGVPDYVQDSKNPKRALATIVADVKRLVKEGITAKFWYEQSAQAVLDITEGNLVEAERIIQLLAIYSPQASVDANVIHAMRGYTKWKKGIPRPTDPEYYIEKSKLKAKPGEYEVGMLALDKKAIELLYTGNKWSGRKTSSFYENLMHYVVLTHTDEQLSVLNMATEEINQIRDPNIVTSDMWVFRALRYRSDQAPDDRGDGKYSVSENILRRVTGEINESLKQGEEMWLPHHVQAAMWAAIRTRYSNSSVVSKTEAESLKKGFSTHKRHEVTGKKLFKKDGAPKVSVPKGGDKRAGHLKVWFKHGMALAPEQITAELEREGTDFGTILKKRSQMVTWETIPSKHLKHPIYQALRNGIDPRIWNKVRQMFTDETGKIIYNEDGINELASLLGIKVSWATPGTGMFEGIVSPNINTRIIPDVPKGRELKKGQTQQSIRRDMADLFSRAIQYIYQQDAQPWMRPDLKVGTEAMAKYKVIISNPTVKEDKKGNIESVTYRAASGGKSFDTMAEAEAFIEQSKVPKTVVTKDTVKKDGTTKKGTTKYRAAGKLFKTFAEAEAHSKAQDKLLPKDRKGSTLEIVYGEPTPQALTDEELDEVSEDNRDKGGAWKWKPVSVGATRGFVIRFKDDLTQDQEAKLGKALTAEFGPEVGYSKYLTNEVVIGNFPRGWERNNSPAYGEHDAFIARMDALTSAHEVDLGILETEKMWSEGNYLTADWKNDPTGKAVLNDIESLRSRAGLPNLQRRLDSWGDAYGQALERYKGEELKARIEEARAELEQLDRVSGTNNREIDSPYFELEDDPLPPVGKFSPAIRAIQDAPQNKGSRDYWYSVKVNKKGQTVYGGILAQSGIKREEIEMMEVEQALSNIASQSAKGTVTRQQLLDELIGSEVIIDRTEGEVGPSYFEFGDEVNLVESLLLSMNYSGGAAKTYFNAEDKRLTELAETFEEDFRILAEKELDSINTIANGIDRYATMTEREVILHVAEHHIARTLHREDGFDGKGRVESRTPELMDKYKDDPRFLERLGPMIEADEANFIVSNIADRKAEFVRRTMNNFNVRRMYNAEHGENEFWVDEIIRFDKPGGVASVEYATPDGTIFPEGELVAAQAHVVKQARESDPSAFGGSMTDYHREHSEPGGTNYTETKYYWSNAPEDTQYKGPEGHLFKTRNIVGFVRSKIRSLLKGKLPAIKASSFGYFQNPDGLFELDPKQIAPFVGDGTKVGDSTVGDVIEDIQRNIQEHNDVHRLRDIAHAARTKVTATDVEKGTRKDYYDAIREGLDASTDMQDMVFAKGVLESAIERAELPYQPDSDTLPSPVRDFIPNHLTRGYKQIGRRLARMRLELYEAVIETIPQEKFLILEEMQSDWIKKGKKYGWRGADVTAHRALQAQVSKDLAAARTAIGKERDKFVNHLLAGLGQPLDGSVSIQYVTKQTRKSVDGGALSTKQLQPKVTIPFVSKVKSGPYKGKDIVIAVTLTGDTFHDITEEEHQQVIAQLPSKHDTLESAQAAMHEYGRIATRAALFYRDIKTISQAQRFLEPTYLRLDISVVTEMSEETFYNPPKIRGDGTYVGDVVSSTGGIDGLKTEIRASMRPIVITDFPASTYASKEAITKEASLEEQDEALALKTFITPMAPMKNNWHEMALRMAMRDAVNQGLKNIGWTIGATQAKRWPGKGDLLSSMKWDEVSPQKYVLEGELLTGGTRRSTVTEDELEAYVGPEDAREIIRTKHGTKLNAEMKKANFANLYDKDLVNYANKLGKKYGIKAERKTIDGLEWWTFVITDEMASDMRETGVPMFSKEEVSRRPKPIRGFYRHSNRELSLTSGAGIGTFGHEMAHGFLFDLLDRYYAGDNEAAEDINKILQWRGLDDISQLVIYKDDSVEVKKAKNKHHEAFANGFLLYKAEGNAPSPALQDIFDKFREWLAETVQRLLESGLELNDDVRDVYGRFLTADAELATAESAIKAHEMTQEQLGMSDEDYALYKGHIGSAVDKARAELDKKIVRSANRVKSKKWKELEKAEKAIVTAEVERERVYAARKALYSTEGIKLNNAEVREMMDGQANAIEILSLTKAARRKKGEGHPQVVAEQLGYESGYEMLRELAFAPDPATEIKKRTRARMDVLSLERDDIAEPQDIGTKEAQDALHNSSFENAIIAEIAALEDLTNRRSSFPVATLKANAKRIVSGLKAGKINPNTFLTRERQAANRAYRAMQDGNPELALEEKSRQLMHQYFAREAFAREKKVEKLRKELNNLTTTKGRVGIDESFLPHIMGVLDRFDLRKNPEPDKPLPSGADTRAFVVSVEEDGDGFVRIKEDDMIYQETRTPWTALTVEQFEVFANTMKNLVKMGRDIKTITLNGTRMDLGQATMPIGSNIEDNVPKGKLGPPEGGLGDKLRAYWVELRKRRNIARVIDGFKDFGAAYQYLIRPVEIAQGQEEERLEIEYENLRALFAKHGLDAKYLSKKKQAFAEGELMLNQEQVLSIGLNSGNAENRSRAIETIAYYLEMDITADGTVESADNILREIQRSIPDEKWAMIQEFWDYLDTFWPEVMALEHRTTGVIPKRVEPESFTTENGLQLRGGYYPIAYDSRVNTRTSDLSLLQEARQNMSGYGAAAMTAHGHDKERVGSGGQILQLELSTIFSHVGQVVHDLTHRETLNGVHKILKALKPVMERRLGAEDYKQWQKWLNRTAIGDERATTEMERWAGKLRGRVTIMGMGLNFSTAALQIMGLTNSQAKIGGKWVGAAMGEYMANRTRPKEWRAEIDAKSSIMRSRALTFNRDVRELQKQLSKNRHLSWWESAMFSPIVAMQSIVDGITWTAAYNKAIHGGASEEQAVAGADSDVVLTQGSGRISDLSGVEGGAPFLKLFTTFYSFMNTLYNLSADQFTEIWRSDRGTAMKMVAATNQLFLLYILPATLTNYVLDILIAGEEPEDEEAWLKWLAMNNMNYMVGQFPFIREVIPNGYRHSGPAGLRFLANIHGGIQTIPNIIPEAIGGGRFGGDDAPDFLDDPLGVLATSDARAIIDSLGVALPLPTTEIKRFSAGALRIQEGDTEGFFDALTGLFFRKAR